MKYLVKGLCVASAVAHVTAKASRENPVSNVKTLLQDLRTKVEKDGEADDANYEKYKCWCEEVDKEKNEQIEKAGEDITRLTGELEANEAKREVLVGEINKLRDEIRENKKVLRTAGDTHAEETLVSEKAQRSMRDTLHQLNRGIKTVGNAAEGEGKATSFLQELTGKNVNPGGSSDIVDLMKGLKHDFTLKLDKETEDYTKAINNFKEFENDKNEEINNIEENKRKKDQEEAATGVQIAEDHQTKDNTEQQLEADKVFLKKTTEACEQRAKEHAERIKLRTEEIAGINKALEVLDENRADLDKAFKDQKTAFVQVASMSPAVKKAYSALLATKSLRVKLLAEELRETPEGMKAVVTAIDGLLTNMKEEAESDKKKKDHCTKEYATVAKEVAKHEFLVKKHTANLATIATKVDKRTAEKAAAVEEIGKSDEELKKLKEIREGANTVYKTEKADDEKAIEVLEKTKQALAEYYEKNTKESLLSVAASASADPLADKEHKYQTSGKDSQKGAANAVIALIEQIQNGLKNELKKDGETEGAAQAAYEQQKKALDEVKAKLQKKVVDAEAMVAERGTEKDSAEKELASSEDELKSQKEYKDGIKEECDWILAKFDSRVEQRESEKDGLVQAKSLLSGSTDGI